MSVSIVWACDVCGYDVEWRDSDDLKEFAADLKKQGWRLSPDEDECPECADRRDKRQGE